MRCRWINCTKILTLINHDDELIRINFDSPDRDILEWFSCVNKSSNFSWLGVNIFQRCVLTERGDECVTAQPWIDLTRS